MRNTIFADKLDAVLMPKGLRSADALTNRSNDLVLGAQRAVRRKLSKNQPAGRPPSTAKPHRMGPRYLESQKPNPFLHHIYAGESAAELLAGIEAENAEEAKPATEVEKPRQPVLVSKSGPEATSHPVAQEPLPLISHSEHPSEKVLPIEIVAPRSDPGSRDVSHSQSQLKPSESLPKAEPGPPATQGPSRWGGEPPAPVLTFPSTSPAAAAPESVETPVLHPTDEDLSVGTPVAVSPPNLTWPEKPTPFDDRLKPIVDRLREARSRIAFTLEQLREQEKKLETEISGVRSQLEKKRKDVRQINDIIAACSLVAEQSAGLPPGLLAADGPHHRRTSAPSQGQVKQKFSMAERLNNPDLLHIEDLRRFFQTHRGSVWIASEIRKQLPADKQEHTSNADIAGMLTNLEKKGVIERVERGKYRAK